MARHRKGAVPPYLLHKATGQAYSTFRGIRTYHGLYGTPESHARYKAFQEQFRQEAKPIVSAITGTIARLVETYRNRVAVHYSRQEQTDVKRDLGQLVTAYGTMDPDQFSPRDLKALRDGWIRSGLARKTINKKVGRVRRCFRWGVSESMVRAETLGALAAVDDLQPGRTTAPDFEPIQPVPLRDLAKTLRYLSARIRALVRLQYYTGARPGEAVRAKVEEFHRSGSVKIGKRTVTIPAGCWAFTPTRHKNQGKGKFLVYLVGPRAQRAILPFLDGRESGYLIQPKEWAEERHANARFPRKRKARPLRTPGQHYRVDSYDRAIEKACKRAGVADWKPGMLRHNWFSRMDKIAGIAAASTAGGHASIATTEIYVERNLRGAADLALRHG